MFAGEKAGHSLLARDSPSLWYEAAQALAPLPAATGAAAAITEEEFEAKKQTAIAALQNEEAVFERDLGQQAAIRAWHSYHAQLHAVASTLLPLWTRSVQNKSSNFCFSFPDMTMLLLAVS